MISAPFSRLRPEASPPPLVVNSDVGIVLHASNEEGCRLSALALRPIFAEGSEPMAVLTREVANVDISQAIKTQRTSPAVLAGTFSEAAAESIPSTAKGSA